MSEYTLEYDLPMGPPDLGADTPVTFVYTWTPGRPAQLNALPEDCSPAEGDEIELVRVDVPGEKRPYRDFTGAWSTEAEAYNVFNNGDDDLHDALIANARECEEGARDDAAEHAAEVRREMANERFE
jgi:hypothetical protein